MHKPHIEHYEPEEEKDSTVNIKYLIAVIMLVLFFLAGSGVAFWIERIF